MSTEFFWFLFPPAASSAAAARPKVLAHRTQWRQPHDSRNRWLSKNHTKKENATLAKGATTSATESPWYVFKRHIIFTKSTTSPSTTPHTQLTGWLIVLSPLKRVMPHSWFPGPDFSPRKENLISAELGARPWTNSQMPGTSQPSSRN